MTFSIPALLLAAMTSAVPTPQALPRTTLRAPDAQLRVQVASTGPQRERGLMGVTHLPPRTGMLFIFEEDAPVAFWMKDTLIPLDMVFVGGDGIVRRVYENVPVVPLSLPDTRIPLEQGKAKYVIELPSGEAQADGLKTGVRVGGLPR
jgi:uncharacterized membrane protein (UPF0127 family)